METKLNVMDKFQRELFHYIKEEQPQLLKEKDIIEFIVRRAERADETYQAVSSKGKPHIEAMEAAMETLYADMLFSPVSYIKEIYEDINDRELTTDEALQIYNRAKTVFPDAPIDFVGTDEEENVKQMLIPYFNV